MGGEWHKEFRMKTLTAFLIVLYVGRYAHAQGIPSDYAAAASYLGRKGDYKSDVFRIGLPRTDLSVRIQGNLLPTPFGFSGWIAMSKAHGGGDVLMGDLALLDAEVNPVMSALLENGLEVTAIHNHFFYADPPIYFMHLHGHGTADDLAHRLKPALDLIAKNPPAQIGINNGQSGVKAGDLDTAALDKIIGSVGEKSGDVFKYTIGRTDLNVSEMGAKINSRMGLNTWASFFGSNADAVVAGDVAMLEREVQGTLKTLRSHKIEVVAMHHHMIGTDPQIIFLHYWGRGKASDLATAFKSALDVLAKPNSGMDH
jgi:hypothetical protein